MSETTGSSPGGEKESVSVKLEDRFWSANAVYEITKIETEANRVWYTMTCYDDPESDETILVDIASGQREGWENLDTLLCVGRPANTPGESLA